MRQLSQMRGGYRLEWIFVCIPLNKNPASVLLSILSTAASELFSDSKHFRRTFSSLEWQPNATTIPRTTTTYKLLCAPLNFLVLLSLLFLMTNSILRHRIAADEKSDRKNFNSTTQQQKKYDDNEWIVRRWRTKQVVLSSCLYYYHIRRAVARWLVIVCLAAYCIGIRRKT